MAIQFNPDRWAQVRETYTKWWDGSLKRPIFQVTQRIGTGPCLLYTSDLPPKVNKSAKGLAPILAFASIIS